MYVCMYVCMYTCIRVHGYARVQTYSCMCVWLCAIMALPLCSCDLSRGYTRANMCKHVQTCVVMCVRVLTRVWVMCAHTGMGYVCTCLCPRAYVHVLMSVMSVMLCYVMLCYVMSVMYTSPRRNHSVHEYKYFVKPLPSAA